jgi:hypothetical protein
MTSLRSRADLAISLVISAAAIESILIPAAGFVDDADRGVTELQLPGEDDLRVACHADDVAKTAEAS